MNAFVKFDHIFLPKNTMLTELQFSYTLPIKKTSTQLNDPILTNMPKTHMITISNNNVWQGRCKNCNFTFDRNTLQDMQISSISLPFHHHHGTSSNLHNSTLTSVLVPGTKRVKFPLQIWDLSHIPSILMTPSNILIMTIPMPVTLQDALLPVKTALLDIVSYVEHQSRVDACETNNRKQESNHHKIWSCHKKSLEAFHHRNYH